MREEIEVRERKYRKGSGGEKKIEVRENKAKRRVRKRKN